MDMERDGLRLIPTHPDLAEALADFYRRNREAFQYIDPVRAGDFFTPEHQRAALERELRDWQEGQSRRFYLERTEAPGRIVGLIGLNNIIWGAFRSAFLGYAPEQGLDPGAGEKRIPARGDGAELFGDQRSVGGPHSHGKAGGRSGRE